MKPVLSIVMPGLKTSAGIGVGLHALRPLRAPRWLGVQMNAGPAEARSDVLLFCMLIRGCHRWLEPSASAVAPAA